MISSVGARAGEGAPGVALLPQAAEWFSQYDGDRNWFYVPSPFVFRIAIPLPTEVLANAVTAVLSLYDAFTCRFVPVATAGSRSSVRRRRRRANSLSCLGPSMAKTGYRGPCAQC